MRSESSRLGEVCNAGFVIDDEDVVWWWCRLGVYGLEHFHDLAGIRAVVEGRAELSPLCPLGIINELLGFLSTASPGSLVFWLFPDFGGEPQMVPAFHRFLHFRRDPRDRVRTATPRESFAGELEGVGQGFGEVVDRWCSGA